MIRKAIHQLNMLSEEEYGGVVSSFNNTYVDYPRDKCVHTLFEEQAEKTPEKTALVFAGKEFTYAQINLMANIIALKLQKAGVSRNDIVAIISKRSYHTVVAILAILKAGAAYLPIDYNYPIDRIGYILKDSNCKSALTYSIDFEVNNQITMENIDYTAQCSNIDLNTDNMDLCAVIYTSGSTGEPKGTLLHHKGVVNYAFGNDALYRGGECVISYATYTFDAFLLDTVLPMIRGKKCVLSTEEEQFTQKPFEKLIESNPNCNLFITPAKLKQFILGSEDKKFLKNISKICIGGEVFPAELIPYFDDKTQIFNVYGPTECSLWISEAGVDNLSFNKSNSTDLQNFDVVSKSELITITKAFNNTNVDYPRDKCVHTLFEVQVEKTPEKTAVIACDITLTYGELNEQANRIAHSLIAKGVKPNDIIAFMLPRKSYLLSAMFGILKSGAAYMPIDPDYPQDRIDYMLADSGTKYCITEDNIGELLSNENTGNPGIEMSSGDLCYCIYTSGSTGKPKGTAIAHKNLVNFCNSNKSNNLQFAIAENCSNVLSIGAVIFDIFLFETALSLLNNLTVVLASEIDLSDSGNLAELITSNNVDCLHCTPSKIELYTDNSSFAKALEQIKVFMLGGESLNEELVKRISNFSKGKIFNGYGPTETTMGVSFGEIENDNISSKILTLSQIEVLSKSELKTVTKDFNNTAADYPRDKCAHTLFEEQAEKTPEKTAVIACDITLTYGELNEQANRIAHSLISKGTKPNDIIAFMLPRKSYLLSVMFGILKSGAAYMPIDPDYPQDRIDYMLQDSGAKFCITEENVDELLDNKDISNPNIAMSSDDLCYCIYTSGSTGNPKGTLLTHENVVNYCDNNNNNVVHSIIKETYKSIVSVTTVGFDIFVTETILPLLNGIVIVLANEHQAKIQKELNELLKEHPVDILQTTPTKMKSLIADSNSLDYLRQLKVIILGGEALDKTLAEQLHQLTDAKIFNIYGPTETTVWVTNAEIK